MIASNKFCTQGLLKNVRMSACLCFFPELSGDSAAARLPILVGVVFIGADLVWSCTELGFTAACPASGLAAPASSVKSINGI